MTRRYENLDIFVTMSSVKPSARAAISGLLAELLKGSTATQKPSSARAAPESGGRVACVAEAGVGAENDAVRVMSRNSLLTSRAV